MTVNNEEHRNIFNLAAFGTTTFGDSTPAATGKARRKLFSKSKYDEIVKRVRYWDVVEGHVDAVTGRHISQEELRKSCEPGWWKERKNYRLQTLATGSDGGQVEHLQLEIRPDTWRVIVYKEMVFDAIQACHVAARHKKVGVTGRVARKTYYNLTDDLIRIFVETCPLCKNQNPVVAQPPTIGNGFRDKFTACVVDYSTVPVQDRYGVTMKYVLVLQDAATGYSALRPIPKVDKIYLSMN